MKSFTTDSDITNPKSDRRRKNDWRFFPTLEKGTKFRVEKRPVSNKMKVMGEDVEEYQLRFTRPGFPTYQYEEAHYGVIHGVTECLLVSSDLTPKLTRAYRNSNVEQTPEDIVEEVMEGCNIGSEILCELLRSGAVTAESVKEAAALVLDSTD